MEFELNDDQKAFVELARQFADQALAPYANDWDQQQIFPKLAIQQAGELGFCGLYANEIDGGLSLSRLDAALIFEQLATGCTTTTAMITIHNMACWMVSEFGTSQFKAQWVKGLTSGQKLASYCLTEPNAGSDAAALQSKAEKVDGGYVISGTKSFISGAGETDLLIVMVRTSQQNQPSDISAFAVPANSEGISFGKKEKKMGWNAQPTREVSFEQVFVSDLQLLAELGQGFQIAMKGLDGGRINIAACSVGTAQNALELAKNYMLERSQFGKKLADFQALQFKLADMATELVAAKQMVYLAANKLDNNAADKTMYCAMAKRFATDLGFRICNNALQIHGGYGYIKDYPIERHFRDVRVHQILEGTNEIMRVIIAKRLLAQY